VENKTGIMQHILKMS